jgi:hypothetical protein
VLYVLVVFALVLQLANAAASKCGRRARKRKMKANIEAPWTRKIFNYDTLRLVHAFWFTRTRGLFQ